MREVLWCQDGRAALNEVTMFRHEHDVLVLQALKFEPN